MSNLKKNDFFHVNGFEKELLKPLYDLILHLENKNVRKAIDIGCGSGDSTKFLIELFPNALISGIDLSEEMISVAKKKLPTINLKVENISNWESGDDYDLILANSVLHWVPEHQSLLPMLISKLRVGGTLAIQMPDNSNEPAIKLMDSVSAHCGLANNLFNTTKTDPRRTPEFYYEILSDNIKSVEIWRTTYFHAIPGGIKGLIKWLKGFGLQRLLHTFNEGEQKYFLENYGKELAKSYSVHKNGRVVIPFQRIFKVATK
jgi:trans-aconitate 2-methyltransferase